MVSELFLRHRCIVDGLYTHLVVSSDLVQGILKCVCFVAQEPLSVRLGLEVLGCLRHEILAPRPRVVPVTLAQVDLHLWVDGDSLDVPGVPLAVHG